MKIDAFTDGSATVKTSPGGYGWVLVVDGVQVNEGNGHMPFASNNDAELEAAIQGLTAAKEYLAANFTAISAAVAAGDKLEITLVSDSQLILGWADGKYKFKQLAKMDKYHELKALTTKLRANTRWVRGHSGDIHNERCDTLANEARTGIEKKIKKEVAKATGTTNIGRKKTGIVCVWYKDVMKVIDLDSNTIEDYDREIHGARGATLEIREEKSR
jgi:ribonuclease HI